MKRNPAHCGMLLGHLLFILNRCGIRTLNLWDSGLSACHLYNAAQKEKLLERSWPDLEFLIAMHEPRHIFMGEPPQNAETYVNRWFLVQGVSAQTFASNQRTGKGGTQIFKASAKNRRSLKMDTAPVFSAIFGGRPNAPDIWLAKIQACFEWPARTVPLSRRMAWDKALRTVIQNEVGNAGQAIWSHVFLKFCQELSAAAQYPNAPEPSRSTNGSDSTKPLSLTGHQAFLLQVFKAIDEERRAVEFDYLGFHRRTWSFFEQLQQSSSLLASVFRTTTGWDLVHDTALASYTVWISLEDCVASQRTLKEFKMMYHPISEVLAEVAERLDKYLATGQGAQEVAGQAMSWKTRKIVSHLGKGLRVDRESIRLLLDRG